MTERYNADDCRLVGEWLGINDGEFGYLYWPNGAARDIEDLIKEFKVGWEIPQIIREALAREGMTDSMSFDAETGEPQLSLITLDDLTTVLEVEWDREADKDRRHALWDAVVKLLKGRKK